MIFVIILQVVVRLSIRYDKETGKGGYGEDV